MDSIAFQGKIGSGVGRHVELWVPGRDELPQAPKDWPTSLCKGSLNVRIDPHGYPDLFEVLGLPHNAKSLDRKPIECTFEIGQSEFGNNKLVPTEEMPHRGSAQVWRAALGTTREGIACWVLRRYGSGLQDQLEIVSDVHLRTEYGLADGQEVEVCLYA
jgi:hypothetical protein